jgi:hypothetical protein
MWVKTTPISITMAPMRCENEVIKTNIGVEAISEVTVGKAPAFRQNSALPPFHFTNFTKDNFAVQIQTDIPFGEAATIARRMMVGQTFSSAGKTVKVENIDIYGQDDKLVTEARLSGGFNGKIYFIGKPVFDSITNVIKMQDFDYQLDTKNFLFKSASWIFQGQIKKMLEKNLTFPLDENIKTLRTTIGQTLENFEIKPGIILTGNLDDVRFDRTFLTKNSIRVDMSARGKLNLDVRGL